MTRSHWLGLFAFVALAGRPTYAGPAEAADSPLAQLPAKAPIVIQIRGLEQTKDRLIAMIKEALPDLGATAEQKINALLMEGLQGRSLKGLAKNGPVFFVFSELPKSNDDEEMKKRTAALIRVTKYAEFRDNILNDEEKKALKKETGYEVTQINGEDIYFVDRGEYTVVAGSKEAAQAFARKPAQGLDGRIAKDQATKLLESDLSVYVDMAAVRSQFGDQIKQAKEELESALDAAEGTAGLEKGQIELVKKMIGPIFQAIDDSEAVVLAADLRKPGLAIHGQASVGGSSKTNQLLKNQRPSPLTDLGHMPRGMMSYSAVQIHEDWVKQLGGYLYGTNSAAKENKNFKAALDELAAAKPRMRLDASTIPLKALQVWTYDDPVKAVAAQLKLIRAVEAGDVFQSAPIKEPSVKEKAQEYGKFTLHYFTAKWDFEKAVEQIPEVPGAPFNIKKMMPELMKKWLGTDVHVWFGTDGKSVVQVVAKDFKEAQALLEQYTQGKNTIGEDSAYKETRKELPKEATFLALADVPAYAKLGFDLVGAMPLPLPVQLPPPGKTKPTYLGLAVALKPDRGTLDIWIPGQAAQEMYKMIEPVIKMFGGAFGGAS